MVLCICFSVSLWFNYVYNSKNEWELLDVGLDGHWSVYNGKRPLRHEFLISLSIKHSIFGYWMSWIRSKTFQTKIGIKRIRFRSRSDQRNRIRTWNIAWSFGRSGLAIRTVQTVGSTIGLKIQKEFSRPFGWQWVFIRMEKSIRTNTALCPNGWETKSGSILRYSLRPQHVCYPIGRKMSSDWQHYSLRTGSL